MTPFRAALHALAWAPFACGLAAVERLGWQPVADAAEIAVRSWDTFTRYLPLVGQPAQRMAPNVHDVGPLEYWLLSIPVHVDPLHGLMWGAAFWCAVAASVAIEAAWSAAGRLGAVIAVAVVLGVVLWMPGIALAPYWNPWFGVMFFLATCSSAIAVMVGRRAWWPVTVATASVAADAHMMFAAASVVLAGVALAVGIADTVRSRGGVRWAVAGVVVAAACWVGPLVQQLTAPVGNVSALIDSRHFMGPRTGLGFGLRAVTASSLPPPVWWTPLQSILQIKTIGARPVWFGVAVIALLVTLLVLAIRTMRSRMLAALVVTSLVVALGTVLTYSEMPLQSLPASPQPLATMNYLMILLFPLGASVWLTVAAFGVAGWRRYREARPARSARPFLSATGVVVAGFVAVTALSATSAVATATETSRFPEVADASAIGFVEQAASQIERALPAQPISLDVRTRLAHTESRVSLGLAWALLQHGYRPEFRRGAADLGAPFALAPGSHLPDVDVRIHDDGSVSVVLGKRSGGP